MKEISTTCGGSARRGWLIDRTWRTHRTESPMPFEQCRGEGPNLVKTISKRHAVQLAKVQHHIAPGQQRVAFMGSMSGALAGSGQI